MDFEDEGLYQCEATNADGQTPKKHQIQVQVQAKPRFKVKLFFTICLGLQEKIYYIFEIKSNIFTKTRSKVLRS